MGGVLCECPLHTYGSAPGEQIPVPASDTGREMGGTRPAAIHVAVDHGIALDGRVPDRAQQSGDIMKTATTLISALALAAGLAACSQPADTPPPSGETEMATTSTPPTLPGSPVFERTGAAPALDFAGVQATLGGEPTRVLVLGTTHLNNLPEAAFSPDHLALVLDRLEGFSPDIVAIEAIGGQTCDTLRRYPDFYPGVADNYCYDPAPALDALGLDQPAAASAAFAALTALPDTPSPAERRELAALFYGAGEPWSAALQWSKLDLSERRAEDGVSDDLVTRLDRMQTSRNENNLIALTLANELGLEHLATMDDHSADIVQTRAPDTLGPVIQSVWGSEHPLAEDMNAARTRYIGSAEAVLDGYRFLNSEAYMRYVIENDFGLATATPDEDAVARQYVAWWQVRGLRMAANVVEAAGNQPGARVLVIVGASHKAYFDAYLDQMHDIELVDVQAVLADAELESEAL